MHDLIAPQEASRIAVERTNPPRTTSEEEPWRQTNPLRGRRTRRAGAKRTQRARAPCNVGVRNEPNASRATTTRRRETNPTRPPAPLTPGRDERTQTRPSSKTALPPAGT